MSDPLEIGMDPIRGFWGNHTLHIIIIQYFHDKGIILLNQIHVDTDPNYLYPTWISSHELGLIRELAEIWENVFLIYTWGASHLGMNLILLNGRG